VFRLGHRAFPMMIGVSAMTTLAVNVVVAVHYRSSPSSATQQARTERFLAAAQGSGLAPHEVAPLQEQLTPHLLVASPTSLPKDLMAKVRRIKGVRGVEVVDAAQGLLAGKRVEILGVEPSTFRNFTPKPTAESDALWRNVAAGDVSVSFAFGADGGVKLGSQVPIGGAQRQSQARVGSYATMGIGEVEAVVSRTTARSLGMPSENALIVSAPKTDLDSLTKRLRKMLPVHAKTAMLNPGLSTPQSPVGELPAARGQVLTPQQIQVTIRAAQTKLGMPYVWGGESDAEGGYDCSGILQYAFARAGVRLPRVAADQARAGWIIPFDKARPGDLLIWAHDPTAPGYISHIALYLGGGKMLAAPRRGTFVRIQPVYFTNFKGAVRINPRQAARVAG
jgi:hypothetical protein